MARQRVGLLDGDNVGLLASTITEVDISSGASSQVIHYTVRADCQLDALGIAVTAAITGGATGNFKFGRVRAGTADDDYYVTNTTIAQNTAQGQEWWTDTRNTNTLNTTLAWAATANTFDERRLNRGDIITFTLAAQNTGKVLPLVRVRKR